MKIRFWAIGKVNDQYIDEGVRDFTNRISNYYPVEWRLFPPVKNAASLSVPQLIKKEGEPVLASLTPADHLIVLDEQGQMIDSVRLSQLMRQRTDEGTKNVVFLIGGAFGIHEDVKSKASFTWSLSRLTFPHQLVRLILSEQVYRACTILRNEKYHHS